MSVGCLASRPAWSSVAGNGTNLTRQEWMYSFLLTLCETLAAAEGVPVSSCSVAGTWDKVLGDGYVSEQQFWATSLNTLCAIKDNISGGGGGSVQVYGGVAPPVAPADPTKAAIFIPDDGTLPFQSWPPGGAGGWITR